MKQIVTGLFALVLAVAVSTIAAANTECNGTISTPVTGGLVVNPGDSCVVLGTSVSGGIEMSGGSLEVCGSTVSGAVKVTGGNCAFLGEPPFGCGGDTVNGHVSIANVTGACGIGEQGENVEIDGTTVNGGADLENNGTFELEISLINGSLKCNGNAVVGSPAPFAGPTVTGQETGQCAGL